MVEHIGVGADSTNVGADNGIWQNPPLKPCPAIPAAWPDPVEHPDCVRLWRKACKAAEPAQPTAAPASAMPSPSVRPKGLRGRLLQWLGGAPSPAPQGQATTSPPPPITFTGNYKDWQSAAAACGEGYQEDEVIDRVREAALKVKRGEARYERDGVAFDDDALPWEMLAGLLRAAAMQRGTLRVLDFGGSLGSHYFQCRQFLQPVRLERWVVVEQPKFVEVGTKEFADDVLHFGTDAGAACRDHAPTVLLISSVLQYLERPHDMLRTLAALRIPHVVVDRTAFWENPDRGDQLAVQTVSPEICAAKYPAWFFQEKTFLADLEDAYTLVSRFDSWETWRVDDKKRARNRGFILDLKPTPS
jgi:putative methyltransferase (TIGR04325 family)